MLILQEYGKLPRGEDAIMIDTILFDLDGTLLWFTQEAFVSAYFSELKKVFVRIGLDAEKSANAVWAGTKAMVLGDGAELNKERFWLAFSEFLDLDDERLSIAETECDRFYVNEFDVVKSVVSPNGISKRMVRALASKGYDVVLATNPLFPQCAVGTRLAWAGLRLDDFCLVTHYANSTYCKPNLGYYKEIFSKLGKTPRQCLMAGNNPQEDMGVCALGAQVYLVTDYLENSAGIDIANYRQGTLADLEAYLMSLPDIA